MGRHSRKGTPQSGAGQQSRASEETAAGAPQPRAPQTYGRPVSGTPPHGVPRADVTPPAGTPRVAPPGAFTPPAGVPQVPPPQGTPAHGSPAFGTPGQGQVRGDHTEHDESVPRPRVRPYLGAPAHPPPQQGPRQEYLDAFDDPQDDVFAAGAPRGVQQGAPPRAPQPPRTPAPRHEPEPSAEGAEPPAPLAPIVPPPRRASRGRTITGIAAAAVTTVLAVTVAGQVSDDASGSDNGDAGVGQRSDETVDEAARSGAARAGDTKGAAPTTYAEKMAAPVPLAADFAGSGSFRTVGGHEKGPGGANVVRYRVDVEKGLPLDTDLFTEAVHKTLNDDRSWAHGGERSFERVSSERADFVISLASPRTTDVWCAKSGLDTSEQKVSCDSAATERVVINAYRWAQGAKTFGDEHLFAYRQMLINHEVGHRLGHGHVGCPEQGALAPVMMQQTKFLSTDGATCRPNAWPYPRD
ncbi:DUF3152 domain-containing protein [Streptomyces sulphureus]|uniref:DUF3152 domain-containing protein n=1 Tax=Streptomyces sulphureus TaxID=47758 RepID=UPI000375EF0E|nr:DUF3152 domain-containing protein [Streptomyces sulphureus]